MKGITSTITSLGLKMFGNIPTFVYSDCDDQNAIGMYASNFVAHVPGCRHVHFGGISHPFEGALTAGGVIKNLGGKQAIVFVNFAPRRDSDREAGHKNGRPFIAFHCGKTLVVASDEPEIWGVFDLLGISYGDARLVTCENFPVTQFRSAYVVPHVARHFLIKENVERYPRHKPESADLLDRVLFRDRFGNLKVVLHAETHEDIVCSGVHSAHDLTEVPDGMFSLIKGSSFGAHNHRISELVIKGGNCGEALGLCTGDTLDTKAIIAFARSKERVASH